MILIMLSDEYFDKNNITILILIILVIFYFINLVTLNCNNNYDL